MTERDLINRHNGRIRDLGLRIFDSVCYYSIFTGLGTLFSKNPSVPNFVKLTAILAGCSVLGEYVRPHMFRGFRTLKSKLKRVK